MSAVEDRYQAMASEDSEDFMCAAVMLIFGMCNSVRLLRLFVIVVI
jgi:hypothetical protein